MNNLPYMSKSIKNAMLHQLNKHTDNNNLVPITVCAHRKNYSTELLLLKIVNNIKMAMDTLNVMLE